MKILGKRKLLNRWLVVWIVVYCFVIMVVFWVILFWSLMMLYMKRIGNWLMKF